MCYDDTKRDGRRVFLKTFGDDAAFNEPWIYILRQDPQIPDPPYYRCGAAGTQLFPDADRPYQASETSRKGLAGRVTQYIGHIRPNKVLLFAALRIKRAVVALEGQRIGGDATTGLYNITRGNQSAVLAAEAVMHHLHDKDRNINRFPEHPDSELFRPSSGVEQLIRNMRRVRGLQMLLFDAEDWREDPKYAGGDATQAVPSQEVQRRAVPSRADKDTTLIVRMTKSGIDQLRSGNPQRFAQLMNLLRDDMRPLIAKPTTAPPSDGSIRLSVNDLEEIRNNTARGKQLLSKITLKKDPPPPPPPGPPVRETPTPPLGTEGAVTTLGTEGAVTTSGRSNRPRGPNVTTRAASQGSPQQPEFPPPTIRLTRSRVNQLRDAAQIPTTEERRKKVARVLAALQ